MKEQIAINKQYFTLHRTGLVVRSMPPLDAWIEAGKSLRELDAAVHWWIGDWLNFGQKAYGVTYEEAIQQTGFAYQTLADDKWIASRVGFSLRKENLTWGHHRIVASLPAAQQERLLNLAEEKQLTIDQLRAEVKEAKALPRGESPTPRPAHALIFPHSSEDMDGRIQDIWGEEHTIPDLSVHLVVTSPPYNNGTEYDAYKDDRPWYEYQDMMWAVFHACYDKLVVGGRIAVNVPNITNSRNRRAVFLPLEISQVLADSGFTPREVITWVKADDRNVAGAITASGVKTTAWGSFQSPSNPYLRSITEAVLVMQKGGSTLFGGRSDITAEEFRKWTYNVWFIPPVSNPKHPAVFPVELARRLIKLYSYMDQTVLDPFMGIGSTALACENRLFIGFDVSRKYCHEAARRLSGLSFDEASCKCRRSTH